VFHSCCTLPPRLCQMAAHRPATVGPKIATTVVSPGDRLWRISRATYGAGTRYAVVYKANRDQIQDPTRIYPGQIFVLPVKAR
jgi:nucleoid-associated protein YgaU